MYCERIEKNDNPVYDRLIQRAAKKGIDVYEVDNPKAMNGLFYNLESEGIKAKIILVNKDSNKAFTLAYLIEYAMLTDMDNGYIMLREKAHKKAAEVKAERYAKRIISHLERWCNL